MSPSREMEIIVRGVCIKDGKLLLCHTKGKDNTYLPGGHIEFGEKVASGLAREIKEEMGLTANVTDFMGGVEHEFVYKSEKHCEINLVFKMDVEGVDSDNEPASCEDYIEFLWVSLSDLDNSTLEPFVLRKKIPEWIENPESSDGWGSTYTDDA